MVRDRRLCTVDDLVSRGPGQNPLRPLEKDWQHRARGLRVEADRRPLPWVPEFGVGEAAEPRALHEADKAVPALAQGFVAAPAQDHNIGVIGDRCLCGVERLRNLVGPIWYEILLEWGHNRVGWRV